MPDITLPEIGESVEKATILTWTVAVGDRVEQGAVIAEVATDKVDTEVVSPFAGTVTELRADVDDEVAVGDVIAVLSD